ncbi:hypothetical protein ACOSP7_007370 [Xanthoceras sorbifolium]
MAHRLNIDLSSKPISQKRRVINAERYVALKEEVDKLLANGFIREPYYPNWLANRVMVKKKNNKCRTCQGIEANPEKIKALRNVRSPTKLAYVQSLNAQVATLSWFISKSTDKCVPFFNVLGGNKKFQWMKELHGASSLIIKTTRHGEVYCLSGDDSVCDKHGFSVGRKQDPATKLLCKQEVVGHIKHISADGEARILPSGGIKEVATLLPSPQYRGID